MYLKFWGLQRQPFIDSIDPGLSYLAGEQRLILQEIVQKAVHPGNLIVLDGVSGIGKTQILKEIELKLISQGYFVLNESLPSLDSISLMAYIKRQIENRKSSGVTNASLADATSMPPQDLSSENIPILLLDGIDCKNAKEIQDFIENFRRLTFRKGAEASPVLVGNFCPQLLEDWKNFWNFQEYCPHRIPSLDREESENYIRHRWRKSGGDADRLSVDVFTPIFELTHGIPREINHLCIISLLVGFSENVEKMSEEIVLKAAGFARRVETKSRSIESQSERELVTAGV